MLACSKQDRVRRYLQEARPSQRLRSTPRPEEETLLRKAPHCLQKILHLMFQLVMTGTRREGAAKSTLTCGLRVNHLLGEFSSMWSISRPLCRAEASHLLKIPILGALYCFLRERNKYPGHQHGKLLM